jgi:hypothetical protein
MRTAEILTHARRRPYAGTKSTGALARERLDQIFQTEFAFLEGGFFALLLFGGMRDCGVVADLLIELMMLDEQLMEILSFGHAPPPDENL